MFCALGSLGSLVRSRDESLNLPHASATGPLLPPDTVPPQPYVVDGSHELLQNVQRMLAIMGTDQRRDTPEFKHLLAQYKRLGAELHAVRQLISASMTATPSSAGTGAKTPAAPYTRPLAQRPGGRAAGTSPLGPGPMTPTPGSKAPLPMAQDNAAVAAPQPPAASTPGADQPSVSPSSTPSAAVSAPAPSSPAPTSSPSSAPSTVPNQAVPPSTMPRPVRGATIPSACPPSLPPDFPLAMPKFASTLGPAASPGAIHVGPEVRRLQELLTLLGHVVQSTGSFDLQTAAAVKARQQERGLKVNGVVSAEMRRLLNEMVTG